MKRRNYFFGVWALVFFFFCTGLANAEQWSDRWKFGTLAPDGVGWARGIKDIVIPAVEKATEGNLSVKVYWGGVMGDDEDYSKKMRIGQLQGAGFSGQGAIQAVPEMAVVSLPFLFNSFEEVDYIKQEMTGPFDEIAKKNGIMNFAWIDEDFCRVYSSALSMTKAQDFQDAKVLSWYGPVEEKLLLSLNARPIPVNMPESPPAMRQGLGNTIIAPAAWVLGTQLYSTVKHVSPYVLRYSPAMIAVAWDSWEEMPEEYKTNYYGMRSEVVRKFVTAVRADNTKSLQAMKDYGVKEATIPPKELALIRESSRTIWEENAGKLYPEELLEELLANLEEFRSQ